MAWNYRVVKKKLSEDEVAFNICEVHYDKEGEILFSVDELSSDTYTDLECVSEKIAKAYKEPVLEVIDGDLVESKTCPKCDKDVIYDVMDLMGDGKEEDFGKTTLCCPGCGYVAIRQNHSENK